MATEVAITTANGKRLRESTRAEVLAYLKSPARVKLYPIVQAIRITPKVTAAPGETGVGT